jgi:hypothetical protein
VFVNPPDESPAQQYLSLAETYDQHSGNAELKWCLTKTQYCLDENSKPIPNDFGALLSLIMRYKDESGTPDKVKNGGKRHFQVRKVLAYTLGEPKQMADLDALVKKHTVHFKTEDFERSGKTEFRMHSAKGVCMEVLRMLANEKGLDVIEPEHNTIAWDFLIGARSMNPRDWVLKKMKEAGVNS